MNYQHKTWRVTSIGVLTDRARTALSQIPFWLRASMYSTAMLPASGGKLPEPYGQKFYIEATSASEALDLVRRALEPVGFSHFEAEPFRSAG